MWAQKGGTGWDMFLVMLASVKKKGGNTQPGIAIMFETLSGVISAEKKRIPLCKYIKSFLSSSSYYLVSNTSDKWEKKYIKVKKLQHFEEVSKQHDMRRTPVKSQACWLTRCVHWAYADRRWKPLRSMASVSPLVAELPFWTRKLAIEQHVLQIFFLWGLRLQIAPFHTRHHNQPNPDRLTDQVYNRKVINSKL